jgi:LysM repeat protein
VLSLGLNLILALAWLLAIGGSRPLAVGPGNLSSGGPSPAGTNTVVRRQFFTWQEVESPDYPTYIANLRDIGCPEQTVRDVIIADVNALFAKRRATEIVTPDQQWWRAEPDTNVLQVALEKLRGLETERRSLLSRLLGTNWETGDLVTLPRPSRLGVVLDGPVLGNLPTDTKQAIEEVNLRSEDRLRDYLASVARDGKNADPLELARIRQQTRVELARILSPDQLEEFLLRYSENASNLRNRLGQLEYFNASPDEFRQMFRSTDYLDEQIAALGDSTDPGVVSQRKALEDQRDNALKTALGTKRYEQYRLLQDPLYRDAVSAAQDAGNPDAAQTIYEVNLAAAQETARINSATNLTDLQRTIALKQAELEQLKASALAAGQELPPEVSQPTQSPPPPPPKVHVLGPGDSLSLLSTLYGIPVADLRAANPNLDLSRLQPGDSITIPPTGLSRSPVPPILPR